MIRTALSRTVGVQYAMTDAWIGNRITVQFENGTVITGTISLVNTWGDSNEYYGSEYYDSEGILLYSTTWDDVEVRVSG